MGICGDCYYGNVESVKQFVRKNVSFELRQYGTHFIKDGSCLKAGNRIKGR